MNKERRLLIQNFFEEWANESMQSLSELPASGSDRQYYRIKGKLRTAVAVYNPWKEENDTFVAYSRHFRTKGLSVPEVYKYDSTQQLYLLEDLGDEEQKAQPAKKKKKKKKKKVQELTEE